MDTILDLPFGFERITVEPDGDGGAFLSRITEPGGQPGFASVEHIPSHVIEAVAGALFRARQVRS